MSVPPPCRALGTQCRQLRVTIHIGTLDGGKDPLDHEATWLLGHTERVSWGRLTVRDDQLYVDAAIHVPCKWLEEDGEGVRCGAHGFRGARPRDPRLASQPRRLGGDRFRVADGQRLRDIELSHPKRPLPVVGVGSNPCVGAPCRTADNTRGAACCRDFQVDIVAPPADTRLEALVRSRQSPYLCKVNRTADGYLEAEIISACDYLDPADGVHCTLHGRARPDGRTAKPALCFDWPPKRAVIHRGCALATRWQRAQHR